MPIDLLKNIADQCPREKVLLGMDVGKKTIGLALSHPGQGVVTPLMTIKRTKFTQDVIELRKVIDEYDIGGFVIGLPVNMDGSEGGSAQRSRDFAAEFSRHLGGDPWIALWDERLSTASVESFVDEYVGKRKTKQNAKDIGLIDKLAAQVILQGAVDYLG